MDEIHITPSPLSGTVNIPPSKSHSLRALLFSMLGTGVSRIDNLLISPDTEAMIRSMALFGAKVHLDGNQAKIEGKFLPPEDVIDAGNSGQILRFIGGVAALLPAYSVITGDASIRGLRPVKPLLGALRQLGALAESARGDGYAPILIRGPIHPGKCSLLGTDSQPVSALLIATSFLDGPSEITVMEPGETPWIDLTLSWLKRLGAHVTHEDYTHYHVKGGLNYSGLNYTVPGDFSTAAFSLIAALITGSKLTLTGLDKEDIQGDKILIDILTEMGAKIEWKEKSLHVEGESTLKGDRIDVNRCIDALPILAVLGCFAQGTTTLYNGSIARSKESNRITAICQELKKMGAQIEERIDGLVIHESPLHGAELFAHRDHRIGLALAVAALGASSPSTLKGASCMAKTYPTFVQDFQTLGAQLELDLVRV